MVVAQAMPATLAAQGQAERSEPPRPAPQDNQDGWLEWATALVPDSCVDARGFADQVARSLGRPPLAAARDAHLTIVARIDRASPPGQPPRWSGEIRVRDDQGHWVGSRTIDREGLSCRPLGDALALATALVLAKEDAVPVAVPPPDAAGAPTQDAPAVPRALETPRPEVQESKKVSTTVSPSPELSASVEAAPPPAKARAWAVGVEGGLATAVGLLPDAALGGTVSVFFRFANGMKLFATGAGWSRQVVSTGAQQGATLELASLGAGFCPFGGAWRGFSGQACARVDVGRLRTTGFGFTVSYAPPDRPTVDAGAGLEVRRPLLGPVYASLSTGLVVPFIRDRISYDDQGVVQPIFRPSPLAGTAELRLGASF